jgi:hypothetical protein
LIRKCLHHQVIAMCHIVCSTYKWCFFRLELCNKIGMYACEHHNLVRSKTCKFVRTCSMVKLPCSINDLTISWVRLLIMPPLNTSRFSNNGTFLKPRNNVCMHISSRLIINSGYFITINNDVLNFLDNNFCGLHDNVMNYFYISQLVESL